MDIPNTRINAIEQIETALKLLGAHGYTVDQLWREHREWLDTIDGSGQVDDNVIKWCHNVVESPISEHFVNGEPEILTAAHAVVGHQYTLSPGQRDVLRDRYGLTPSSVVVLTDLGFYRNTQYISTLTLKSAQHVDPRLRTRVLNEVVLRPAWEFFASAHAKDKAREEVRKEKEKVEKAVKVKQATSIALQYI